MSRVQTGLLIPSRIDKAIVREVPYRDRLSYLVNFAPRVDVLACRCVEEAWQRLGWKPEVSFRALVAEMIREDLKEAERDQLCNSAGFRTFNGNE